VSRPIPTLRHIDEPGEMGVYPKNQINLLGTTKVIQNASQLPMNLGMDQNLFSPIR
jgi:hypothetical protein